jgi:hypothetical protein
MTRQLAAARAACKRDTTGERAILRGLLSDARAEQLSLLEKRLLSRNV